MLSFDVLYNVLFCNFTHTVILDEKQFNVL